MSRIRGKNTAPELIVRRLLHAMGFRYRLHAVELPGKPDIVFRPRKKVVFVHGCYWHGHGCPRGGAGPKSNQAYWLPKIARNRDRDERNRENLEKLGWKSVVIWECETKNKDVVAEQLRIFLEN